MLPVHKLPIDNYMHFVYYIRRRINYYYERKDYTMDTVDYTQLDTANKQDNHYSRYPIALINARDAWQAAAKAHTEVADLWERGAATGEDMGEAWDCYIICLEYYNSVYDSWMRGDLAEQLLDAELEQLHRDAEIAEDHELGRIGRGG